MLRKKGLQFLPPIIVIILLQDNYREKLSRDTFQPQQDRQKHITVPQFLMVPFAQVGAGTGEGKEWP
jgi:hypothetical protein